MYTYLAARLLQRSERMKLPCRFRRAVVSEEARQAGAGAATRRSSTRLSWADALVALVRLALAAVRACGDAARKRHSFMSFPYVCPEPVLVK